MIRGNSVPPGTPFRAVNERWGPVGEVSLLPESPSVLPVPCCAPRQPGLECRKVYALRRILRSGSAKGSITSEMSTPSYVPLYIAFGLPERPWCPSRPIAKLLSNGSESRSSKRVVVLRFQQLPGQHLVHAFHGVIRRCRAEDVAEGSR